ncbi:DUF1410 domain-containing protein [Mesomycoplasma neurolyticum]|uniref:DUF1410 domain n=1 Tax=Mesomycoplasma neurolyticum TaxID=2120 RepID=A0A449A5G3_9BACT|nr:DUF1410 domain-containing protein [Mesomycoplasma neurolyticum]VEU59467.1 DUF1410 domain [Mesomycoplasma neurolyticum]
MKNKKGKQKNKKVLALAILGTFFGSSAVILATIPWLIERYNMAKSAISIFPEIIRVIKDDQNNNKFYAKLISNWKDKEVEVIFEDEQKKSYIAEGKINKNGELIIDTAFLPKGKKYYVTSVKDKKNEKDLIDMDKVYINNKIIDKSYYYDKNNKLTLQKNFGTNNANKKVKLKLINDKDEEKELEVTLDKDGIATVVPSDHFPLTSNSKYAIKSWENVDGTPLVDLNNKKEENKPKLNNDQPTLVYDKDLDSISKWTLPLETGFLPNSTLTFNYKKGSEVITATVNVNPDGTISQDDINKLSDISNVDSKSFKLNNQPIDVVDRRQYQVEKHNIAPKTFSVDLGPDKANKPIDFKYQTTLPNGEKKNITITKQSDEKGNVILPTQEDIIREGGKGFEWDLDSITTNDPKDDKPYSVYDKRNIDRISPISASRYIKNKKDTLAIPFLSDKDKIAEQNDKYRVSFVDDEGNIKTVDVNPKLSDLDQNLRILEVPIPGFDSGKSKISKIEKIGDNNQVEEDVTEKMNLSDLHKSDLYVTNDKFYKLSSSQNKDNPKATDISYPLGKENANQKVDLIAYDEKNNKIVVEGTTDENGVFHATTSKFRGKNITLDSFVPRGKNNDDKKCEDCIVDFNGAPKDIKEKNFSIVETPKGKEYIFDVEKKLTKDEILSGNVKPKALIVNPTTGETREIELEVDPENKTFFSLPDNQLKPEEKIDKIFNPENNKTIVENKDIPEEKRNEHKLPNITNKLNDNKTKNELIIKDLPSTIKPKDKVIVEFETKNEPKETILKEVEVDDEGKIIIDINDLPKDKDLVIKAIRENKTPNGSSEPVPGHELVDLDNIFDQDKSSSEFEAKHINKIAVKSITTNPNEKDFDLSQFIIDLEDDKNLIQSNSPKANVIIIDNSKREYVIDHSKIEYQIDATNNTKKLLVKMSDLDINQTYSIFKIYYNDNDFGEDKNNTLNPDDKSNIIYQKDKNSINDVAEYNKNISIISFSAEENGNWSSGNNTAQNFTITIDIETNMSKEELEHNQFALKYVNKSNDADVVYNENKPEVIDQNDKKQLKFSLQFKQSNREYDFAKLVIYNSNKELVKLKTKEEEKSSSELLKKEGYQIVAQNKEEQGVDASKVKNHNIKTKKGKTELKDLNISPSDTDEISFSFEVESEDAPFERDQEYEVTFKDEDGNTKTIIVTPNEVNNPQSGEKQNKNAKFEGKISGLEENKKYEFVGVKPAKKEIAKNPDEQKPHFSDNIVDDPFASTDPNNPSNSFDLDKDSKTEKEKEIKTLDSTKQVVEIKTADSNGTAKDEFNVDDSPKITINFANILEKWKNKTIILEYHSTFDENEKAFFSANISQKTKPGDIDFKKTENSVLLGNRVYSLAKGYYLLNTDLVNIKNLDEETIKANSITMSPEDQSKNKNSFKTLATDEKNALTISKVEQKDVSTLDEANLRIYFEDKDGILLKNTKLSVKFTLKDHLKNDKANLQPIETNVQFDETQKDTNNKVEKYIDIKINGLAVNQIDNTIDEIKIDLTNAENQKLRTIATNHWVGQNNNEIIIKSDYTNNSKEQFGNELKFQGNSSLTERIDNDKVIGETTLKLLFDDTNKHLNNTKLKNSLRFRAEMVQSAQSYKHKVQGQANSTVKVVETNSFSVMTNDEIKVKFSDLVSNRQYKNFRLYVGNTDDAFVKATSLPPENLLNILNLNIREFITTSRESKATVVSSVVNSDSTPKTLKIKYKLESKDEVLVANDKIKLKLVPIGTGYKYNFEKIADIQETNGEYFVEFTFQIVANTDSSGNVKFKAKDDGSTQTYTNNEIEEGIDYAVTLSFNGSIDRAFNKAIKVNGVNGLINKDFVNNESQHEDDSIKKITTPGEVINFKGITFENQIDASASIAEYNAGSSVTIKVNFEKTVAKIANQTLALEFKTKIVDDDGNIVEKTIISQGATVTNDGNNKSQLTVQIDAKDNLLPGHLYQISKIKILDENNQYQDLEHDNAPIQPTSGQFKVKSSNTNMTASGFKFNKDLNSFEKANVSFEINDIDNVISFSDKDKLTIQLSEKANMANESEWITVDKSNINITYKEDDKNTKVVTFSFDNPKANSEYVITVIKFETLAVPAYNLDTTSDDNTLLESRANGSSIANQSIKLSNNPTLETRTRYLLTSDMFDLSADNITFKFHYKNKANQKSYFGNALSATKITNSSDGDYEITEDSSSLSNGEYQIEQLYVGPKEWISAMEESKLSDSEFMNKLSKVDISILTDDHKILKK